MSKGFSADSFMKNGLPLGGARANLFKITFAVPGGDIDVNGSATIEELKFRAKGTTVPSSTIEAVEVPYGGRNYRFAGSRTYEDWTCTITIDADQKEKDFFEKWNHGINNREDGTGAATGYWADIQIEMLDSSGDTKRTYILHDAWPHTVGELTLDWAETGTILETEITWAYSYWDVKA